MDTQKVNTIYSTGSRFSYIQLALNYYTLSEDASEHKEEYANSLIMELNGIIERTILDRNHNVSLEDEISKLDTLRNRITAIMESLTTYVDHFQIYEYVLNRVEYRLNDTGIVTKEMDTAFEKKLMQFITGTKEDTVLNSRIQGIVGQLPIRLTKAKFYNLLMDGLSIYKNVSKTSIENIIYMLRTSAMMTEPEKENFEVLWDLLDILQKTNYKTMEKDEF